MIRKHSVREVVKVAESDFMTEEERAYRSDRWSRRKGKMKGKGKQEDRGKNRDFDEGGY